MRRPISTALKMLLLMTLLTGAAYPLVMTGLSKVLFPVQSGGSILYRGETPVGSGLIGQKFVSSTYFHGRPSLAGADGYDAANSAGSNMGPTNQALMIVIKERAEAIRKENGMKMNDTVPGDLVTASASGLDPHITLAAAYVQVERVAKARNVATGDILRLIDVHLERGPGGILGEPRFNVLQLNLALDRMKQ